MASDAIEGDRFGYVCDGCRLGFVFALNALVLKSVAAAMAGEQVDIRGKSVEAFEAMAGCRHRFAQAS